MANKAHVAVSWDWKASPDLSKLEELGIFVYEDPRCEGTDQIGYIFSKSELDEDELEDIILESEDDDIDELGDDADEDEETDDDEQ